MRLLRAFFARLTAVLPSARREKELADELDAHLQMHVEDNLRLGMTPDEARREALMKLGGVEPIKQIYRERRSVPLIENMLSDFRFAMRQLRKNPGFTMTAVFILALGLCAAVAIFAFVDAALIKPLPYRDPQRLVGVFEKIESCPNCCLSYLDYLDWKKMNKSFASLDVFQHTGASLNTANGAEPASGARVSDGFFRTLGVTPVLGRDFYRGEDLAGAPNTVLLSYASWKQRFGGREDVLGQTVNLNGTANTIIGVLPKDFSYAPAEPAEFWTALHAGGGCEDRRGCHNLWGVARLKDGTTIETALADVTLIAKQLEAQYPDSNRGQGASLLTLSDYVVGSIRPILLVLLGGAGLLLLIASVNVASLLLVRSESRRKEISVRSALGASASRLASQFVTEALVLVIAGGLLGAAAASWFIKLLLVLIPADMLAKMAYLRGLGLNARVLAFGGTAALLAAVLCSITPVVHFSLSRMREGLAEGSRGSAGRGWSRVGAKLIVLELATAMVLLAAAGLLGKSLYRLMHVDTGMRPDHLVTISVAAPRAYETGEKAIALERLIIEKIESLPGVTSSGVTTTMPVSFWGNTTWLRVLGRPWHGEHYEMPERDVSTAYFTTLGAKLARGRWFTETDDTQRPKVAIINQSFAKQYFPGEDPLTKQLSSPSATPVPIQIVGIVEDVREGPLDTNNFPAIYFPFKQNPDNYFTVMARTSDAEQPLIAAMGMVIREIDRDIVTKQGMTMTAAIDNSYAAYVHRSSAWLVGGFAALALLLGVVGLYGVVAYSVSQRTREIGVRMALGADRGNVYKLVLKEAVWLTAAGVGIGLGCSLGAAMLIRSLLFGVKSWDVETLGAVTAILIVAAILASFIPARRAASLNPVDALRAE